MGNGGVNYKDGVLFCAQGTFTDPGGLVYMSSEPPYTTHILLNNYHGRWFNSVNDVVVHSDGSIWFTDPTYAFEQDLRPRPQLPSLVYRFDPATGDVRAVADGFGKPNGICFSPDERTVYITDTNAVHGDGIYEPDKHSSMYVLTISTSSLPGHYLLMVRVRNSYAFDLVHINGSPFLTNRRFFALCDTGIPDGIKCDLHGNVYSGCGDGVNVWNAGGSLIGKIYVPGGCANFCFGKEGEMFLLNEQMVWRAQLASGTRGALLGI
jgi:gluconolactonase